MNKSTIQIQSEMIFNDLRKSFIDLLEINEVRYIEYNELDQGNIESHVKEPYDSILNSVDLMILEMGFDSFEEWAFDYYELENDQKWIKEWSKLNLKSVYRYLKGEENENNG